MRYSNIIENDVVNGEGICVSLFMQGCPHKCKGCFNPETWNFTGGKYIEIHSMIAELYTLLNKNNIKRNLSILGGEPFCKENRNDVLQIINHIKTYCPDIKIFVWTGYTAEELLKEYDSIINLALKKIDYLIDGPYIEEKKDLTFKWRGSSNQRILTKKEIFDIMNNIKLDVSDIIGESKMTNVNLGTLYDMNKMAIQQIKPMNRQELLQQIVFIEDFLRNHTNKYFMLLNRETYNFTLFNLKDKTENTITLIMKDFEECLNNRGQILSIDRKKDGNFEIWIKDHNAEETLVYYFFPYDIGVIEHGKEE